MRTDARGVLYEEHLLLGVQFDDNRVPLGYGQLEGADAIGAGEVALADLTHVPLLCFSGSCAQDFAQAALAGRRLRVGECAFEAALTGDGGLASIPFAMRTGDQEYVIADGSPRHEVLHGWLSFLTHISQDGVEPFAGLRVDDVTGSHVVLGLWGEGATDVLADYLTQESLPMPGRVASCHLDKIPCIVVCQELGGARGYVILAPPQFGVALWRSLLSFTQVVPRGQLAVRGLLRSFLQWLCWLDQTGPVRKGASDLLGAGLLRSAQDFVGARGLDD